MPTYACTTQSGRLSAAQRAQIVESLTAIHARVAAAPRYLVQVVFYETAPGSHFIGGEPAPPGQIWIRADIRSGRTHDVKTKLLEQIMDEVSQAAAVTRDRVWVYINDIPATDIAEYGSVLPPPGDEADWLLTLPEALQIRLRAHH